MDYHGAAIKSVQSLLLLVWWGGKIEIYAEAPSSKSSYFIDLVYQVKEGNLVNQRKQNLIDRKRARS